MPFHIKYFTFIAILCISCSDKEKSTEQTAIFGGGCFWTLDYYFEKVDGVKKVNCVYTERKSEAVSLLYDPQKVSFKKLCKIFMAIHDPETNYKAKYTSIIQTNNEEDFKIAQAIIRDLKKSKDIKTIVTGIDQVTKAEDMHEDWHKNKKSEPKCEIPHSSFEELLKKLN